MSFIGNTIGKVIGGITGASQQADAAKSAAATQSQAAQQAINQQQAQYAQYLQQAQPYLSAGQAGLTGYQNLSGLGGNAAQQTAIDQLKSSSQFNELNAQGQNAILQNASATGGLRGGNVQGALAQFSPALLNGIMQQQLSNYGNIASLGQNAVAGVGNAGMNNANAVSSLLNQQGAATAGGQLAQGNLVSNSLSSGLGLASSLFGAFGGLGGIGGTASKAASPYMNFNIPQGGAPINSNLLQNFKF